MAAHVERLFGDNPIPPARPLGHSPIPPRGTHREPGRRADTGRRISPAEQIRSAAEAEQRSAAHRLFHVPDAGRGQVPLYSLQQVLQPQVYPTPACASSTPGTFCSAPLRAVWPGVQENRSSEGSHEKDS